MKKVMFLLATLLIGGMMFTGCKKDNPQPTPDTPSTPTETTKTFVYKVNNTFQTMSDVTGTLTTHTISPCFHYTFSYKDADGKMVEVTDATLPWTKEISVKTPFEAQLKGKVTYNESEIPTPVFFGTLASIGTAGVPGAGLIMLAMVLQSVGLPIEGLALVAGIDRVLDMFRTCLNITGDPILRRTITAMMR